jgi:uncharacterized RDD family membrane protein YckC
MICPNCGYSNHDGVIHCLQCGLPVNRVFFAPEVFSGMGRRTLAFLLDMVILSAITLPIVILLQIDSFWLYVGMTFLLYIVYGMLLETTKLEGTLGKKVLRMRVVDAKTGNKLTFTRSFLRNITKLISILALFTGVLVGIFSDDKRCFHDLFGKDYVLPVDSNPNR